MKPRIGITLDYAESGSFSKRPHYALRTHYFDAVHHAGGLAVGIPQTMNAIDSQLDNIDALIVPGGGFASPPEWYEEPEAEMAYEPSPRLQFDMKIISAALEKNIPLLGICAGMQILAGVRGCRMTHNVHTRYKTDIDHMNGAPAEEICHNISIEKNTLLHKVYGKSSARVNSAHCEAVTTVSEGLIASAHAPDGVIEAVELPDHRFALGVQWHPEFFFDEPVIPALIDAAKS